MAWVLNWCIWILYKHNTLLSPNLMENLLYKALHEQLRKPLRSFSLMQALMRCLHYHSGLLANLSAAFITSSSATDGAPIALVY